MPSANFPYHLTNVDGSVGCLQSLGRATSDLILSGRVLRNAHLRVDVRFDQRCGNRGAQRFFSPRSGQRETSSRLLDISEHELVLERRDGLDSHFREHCYLTLQILPRAGIPRAAIHVQEIAVEVVQRAD
ncbi:hypothetical protein D9M68_960230 [compost metagenome]